MKSKKGILYGIMIEDVKLWEMKADGELYRHRR